MSEFNNGIPQVMDGSGGSVPERATGYRFLTPKRLIATGAAIIAPATAVTGGFLAAANADPTPGTSVSVVENGTDDLTLTFTETTTPSDPNATVTGITWTRDGMAQDAWANQQSVSTTYTEPCGDGSCPAPTETISATVTLSDGEQYTSPDETFTSGQPISTATVTGPNVWFGNTASVPASQLLSADTDIDYRDLDAHELQLGNVETGSCTVTTAADGSQSLTYNGNQAGNQSCVVDVHNQEIKDNHTCFTADGNPQQCEFYTTPQTFSYNVIPLHPATVSISSPEPDHQASRQPDGVLDVTVTDENTGKATPDTFKVVPYDVTTHAYLKPHTYNLNGTDQVSETQKWAVKGGTYKTFAYERGVAQPSVSNTLFVSTIPSAVSKQGQRDANRLARKQLMLENTGYPNDARRVLRSHNVANDRLLITTGSHLRPMESNTLRGNWLLTIVGVPSKQIHPIKPLKDASLVDLKVHSVEKGNRYSYEFTMKRDVEVPAGWRVEATYKPAHGQAHRLSYTDISKGLLRRLEGQTETIIKKDLKHGKLPPAMPKPPAK